MKTTNELNADKNKALSTLGYGIMWLFVAVLVGILPFLTDNGNMVFYLSGTIALVIGIIKLVKGIKKLSRQS